LESDPNFSSVFTLGVALWLLYGLLMHAWPIVIANAITLTLAGGILLMKIRYGAEPPRSAPASERSAAQRPQKRSRMRPKAKSPSSW
jgi:hypothetical protein